MRDRVLIVSPFPPPYGGIASYADRLFEELRKRDIQVEKYNTAKYERLRTKKDPDTRSYHRLFHFNHLPLVAAVCSDMFTFPLFVLKHNPGIIHVHTASFWAWWRSVIYILMGRLLGKKAVIHVHNAIDKFYFQESGKIGQYLIRKSLLFPDYIITLSDGISEMLKTLTSKPIRSVYNGVNTVKFQNNKQYGKPLKVLFAGFVGPEKGVPDLLRAVAACGLPASELLVTIMGNGEIDAMRKLARSAGIDKQIDVTGPVSEEQKITLFKSHHVLALPSHQEGQPIAILEGMASGMAILSTRVGSIPEIIVEGKNGFLVETGDIEAISAALKRLSHRDTLKAMGITNQRTAKEKFDFERVVNDNLGVYKLLGLN